MTVSNQSWTCESTTHVSSIVCILYSQTSIIHSMGYFIASETCPEVYVKRALSTSLFNSI